MCCGPWALILLRRPLSSVARACGRSITGRGGLSEHNDPPGYQSRAALKVKLSRPTMGTDTSGSPNPNVECRHDFEMHGE